MRARELTCLFRSALLLSCSPGGEDSSAAAPGPRCTGWIANEVRELHQEGECGGGVAGLSSCLPQPKAVASCVAQSGGRQPAPRSPIFLAAAAQPRAPLLVPRLATITPGGQHLPRQRYRGDAAVGRGCDVNTAAGVLGVTLFSGLATAQRRVSAEAGLC